MHIDSTRFGEIVVDGRKFHQVLIVGGEVLEREYKRLTDLFGTSHRIGEWEAERLLEGDPEILILGTGENGKLEVQNSLMERFRAKGIEVEALLTPEAVRLFNRRTSEGRRVNALIHTTC